MEQSGENKKEPSNASSHVILGSHSNPTMDFEVVFGRNSKFVRLGGGGPSTNEGSKVEFPDTLSLRNSSDDVSAGSEKPTDNIAANEDVPTDPRKAVAAYRKPKNVSELEASQAIEPCEHRRKTDPNREDEGAAPNFVQQPKSQSYRLRVPRPQNEKKREENVAGSIFGKNSSEIHLTSKQRSQTLATTEPTNIEQPVLPLLLRTNSNSSAESGEIKKSWLSDPKRSSTSHRPKSISPNPTGSNSPHNRENKRRRSSDQQDNPNKKQKSPNVDLGPLPEQKTIQRRRISRNSLQVLRRERSGRTQASRNSRVDHYSPNQEYSRGPRAQRLQTQIPQPPPRIEWPPRRSSQRVRIEVGMIVYVPRKEEFGPDSIIHQHYDFRKEGKAFDHPALVVRKWPREGLWECLKITSQGGSGKDNYYRSVSDLKWDETEIAKQRRLLYVLLDNQNPHHRREHDERGIPVLGIEGDRLMKIQSYVNIERSFVIEEKYLVEYKVAGKGGFRLKQAEVERLGDYRCEHSLRPESVWYDPVKGQMFDQGTGLLRDPVLPTARDRTGENGDQYEAVIQTVRNVSSSPAMQTAARSRFQEQLMGGGAPTTLQVRPASTSQPNTGRGSPNLPQAQARHYSNRSQQNTCRSSDTSDHTRCQGKGHTMYGFY